MKKAIMPVAILCVSLCLVACNSEQRNVSPNENVVVPYLKKDLDSAKDIKNTLTKFKVDNAEVKLVSVFNAKVDDKKSIIGISVEITNLTEEEIAISPDKFVVYFSSDLNDFVYPYNKPISNQKSSEVLGEVSIKSGEKKQFTLNFKNPNHHIENEDLSLVVNSDKGILKFKLDSENRKLLNQSSISIEN